MATNYANFELLSFGKNFPNGYILEPTIMSHQHLADNVNLQKMLLPFMKFTQSCQKYIRCKIT